MNDDLRQAVIEAYVLRLTEKYGRTFEPVVLPGWSNGVGTDVVFHPRNNTERRSLGQKLARVKPFLPVFYIKGKYVVRVMSSEAKPLL